jgi:GT2 family glycosyltransferase
MERHPTAAVVVLTHNDYASRYLADCIAGLRAQTYPAERFAVFLVANGIDDEQAALIGRIAPEVRVLRNPTNLGWGGGNNAAIRVALGEGRRYVALLNIDTVVDRDWLARLIEHADTHPDLHILQSKILLDGTGRINSLGNRIQFLGYGYCNGYGDADTPSPPAFPMDYASGAAMLVRREVFERIGLFREDYLIYYDDTEFCWRARLAGFNVGLAPESVCRHKYEFSARVPMLYQLQRNRLLTLLSLPKIGSLLLIAPCLLVSEVLLAGYFIARGWGGTVWRLVTEFARWRTWASIAERRRQMRALRVRPDAEIVRHFAAHVVFAEVDSPAMRHLLNPLLGAYWAIVKRFIVW